jgi:hypothetical protein
MRQAVSAWIWQYTHPKTGTRSVPTERPMPRIGRKSEMNIILPNDEQPPQPATMNDGVSPGNKSDDVARLVVEEEEEEDYEDNSATRSGPVIDSRRPAPTQLLFMRSPAAGMGHEVAAAIMSGALAIVARVCTWQPLHNAYLCIGRRTHATQHNMHAFDHLVRTLQYEQRQHAATNGEGRRDDFRKPWSFSEVSGLTRAQYHFCQAVFSTTNFFFFSSFTTISSTVVTNEVIAESEKTDEVPDG